MTTASAVWGACVEADELAAMAVTTLATVAVKAKRLFAHAA